MGKIRILLADDHTVMREGTRLILEAEADLEVVAEARDGEETVRLALAYQPDVVVLDITMPKLNGIKAVREIAQRLPSTRFVVLTGYDYEQYLMAALKAGVTGYFLKSVSGRQLVEGIRAVVGGDMALQPEITKRVVGQLATALKWQQKAVPHPDIDAPTAREIEVVSLLSTGASNKEIADQLGISVRTVEYHLGSIFSKLDASSRTEAVVKAFQKGWVDRELIS